MAIRSTHASRMLPSRKFVYDPHTGDDWDFVHTPTYNSTIFCGLQKPQLQCIHNTALPFVVPCLLDFLSTAYFLHGKGPPQRTHSSLKAYCATLWLRWLVVFFFSCNGAVVEWNWQGKTEERGEKPVPVLPCQQQIPHRLTRHRTRASAVGGRRPTAWAIARPTAYSSLSTGYFMLLSC
jgi:hypothetical protein